MSGFSSRKSTSRPAQPTPRAARISPTSVRAAPKSFSCVSSSHCSASRVCLASPRPRSRANLCCAVSHSSAAAASTTVRPASVASASRLFSSISPPHRWMSKPRGLSHRNCTCTMVRSPCGIRTVLLAKGTSGLAARTPPLEIPAHGRRQASSPRNCQSALNSAG